MLFNSFTFFIFLPIVFSLYWLIASKGVNYRNYFLLISSYVFYGWWDYRFLSLIIFSSLVDYIIGRMMYSTSTKKTRLLLLLISIGTNLGLLCFFKYFNFFIESFSDMFSIFGISLNASTLRIILPVGISFYTFQTLSYTIDIYRKKLKPIQDPVTFFTFVSFFPQLVAGPIERAKNLLPQLTNTASFSFNMIKGGCQQIVWGLFKKISNCG